MDSPKHAVAECLMLRGHGEERTPLSAEQRALRSQLAEWAKSCGGVITATQCHQLGASDSDIRTLIRPPYWHRLRRGVYALTLAGDSPDAHRHLLECAALLARLGMFDGEAAVSHVSALRVLRLPLPQGALDARVAITRRPCATSHAPKGAVVHVRDYEPSDVAKINGVPVLTGARLVLDCCEFLPPASSLAVADAVLRRRSCQLDDMVMELEHRRNMRFRDVAKLVIQHADPLSENWFESVSRWYLLEAGLPRPELQVPFVDESGRVKARVDMLFRDAWTVGEADGQSKYTDQHVLFTEKQREDWLRDQPGVEVVRWVPAQLRSRASRAQLVDRFEAAFRRSARHRRST